MTKELLIERIEGMRSANTWSDRKYNQALDDVLKIVREEV